LIIALVTSLTFLQLGNQARELQYRVFAIFIVTVLPALVSEVLGSWPCDRPAKARLTLKQIIAQAEPQFVRPFPNDNAISTSS